MKIIMLEGNWEVKAYDIKGNAHWLALPNIIIARDSDTWLNTNHSRWHQTSLGGYIVLFKLCPTLKKLDASILNPNELNIEVFNGSWRKADMRERVEYER